jgi:leucyl aminopeptidase
MIDRSPWPASVQLSVQTADLAAVEADAIVVNLFQGVTRPVGAMGAIDQALGGRIGQAIAAGGLKGRLAETLVLFAEGGVKSPRVVVVGLGKQAGFGEEAVRRAAAAAAKAARSAGARTLATIAHGAGIGGLDPETAARATVEGALLGLYRFDAYKSKAKAKADKDAGADAEGESGEEGGSGREVTGLILVGHDAGQQEALTMGARSGEAVAAGGTWRTIRPPSPHLPTWRTSPARSPAAMGNASRSGTAPASSARVWAPWPRWPPAARRSRATSSSSMLRPAPRTRRPSSWPARRSPSTRAASRSSPVCAWA